MRRLLRRRALAGFVAIMSCAGLLLGCGGSGSSNSGGNAGSSGSHSPGSASGGGSPVTFSLVSVKIPGSDLLTGYSAGAHAALEEINDHLGGFGGRTVSVTTCNSMIQTAVATTCAHKTLAKHPVAMFGCEPGWSSSGLVVYAAAKVPSFNCLNTTADGNNAYSFALAPGGYGLQAAMAHYLCSRSDVKKVVELAIDIPAYREGAGKAVGKPLSACGKTLREVFFPANATDVSPYVSKAAALKPDFLLLLPLAGISAIQIYKNLEQQGIPASHVIVVESNLDDKTLAAAGTAMNGTYGALQFSSWSHTSDPSVATYLKAAKAAHVDPRNANVEDGYASVMFFYEAAKKIGFSHFNSSSLVNFMNRPQNSGFPIPLSRKLVIPGPDGYAHERQPFGQIAQWKNGRLSIVGRGGANGWVNGFQP